MSLLHYEADFSDLNPVERDSAEKLLSYVSNEGLIWRIGTQSAEFFLEAKTDPSELKLPENLHLRRIP